MNGDLIQALRQIEKERNIPIRVLLEAVESALTSSYRKNFETGHGVRVNIDIEGNGSIRVIALKSIVTRRKDPDEEISLAQAKKYFDKGEILAVYPPAEEKEEEPEESELAEDREMTEEEVAEELARLKPLEQPTIADIIPGNRVDILLEENPKRFGRIAAQTTKQVIKQKLREAERDIVFDEYHRRIGEVISVTVQRHEGRTWVCEMGKVEGIIPPQEQVPTEHFRRGERIKAFILNVEKTPRGPQIILSRSHPGLIRRLFEMEVPEIGQNLIEIHNVAREPGARSKVSVRALEPNVDPLGACVGPRGSRVQMVVDELRGEKIDIINYTADPFTFVSNALSPARVLTVTLNPEDRSALVIVPDDQFSLAIGKEGQNARLAAKLTNWKIDIKSEAQAHELEQKRKVEEEKKKSEEQIRRQREDEEKKLQEEEERRRLKEEEDKLDREEKMKLQEEEERRRKEEEARRQKEEEELRKLREYVPKFEEVEDLDIITPQQASPEKKKKLEEAFKHIPDDIPVEQYVAMAYGDTDIYPDAYYGKPEVDQQRGGKKKDTKKKKKKQRRGGDFDFEY